MMDMREAAIYNDKFPLVATFYSGQESPLPRIGTLVKVENFMNSGSEIYAVTEILPATNEYAARLVAETQPPLPGLVVEQMPLMAGELTWQTI